MRRGERCFSSACPGGRVIVSETTPVVFVIDDNPALREALDGLIRSVHLSARTFASTDEFLACKRPDAPGCLVLDVRLPGLSGLDFQCEMIKSGIDLPVIFITGHGDVPMSQPSPQPSSSHRSKRPRTAMNSNNELDRADVDSVEERVSHVAIFIDRSAELFAMLVRLL